ncbi:MAG: transglycosylase, partial [Gallionella sp.]
MRLLLFFLAIVAHHALAESSPPTKQQDIVSKIMAGYPIGMPHSEDESFISLHKAFLDGDSKRVALSAQRLSSHPLEVYASYYQLRLNLDSADQQAIESFLARKEDTPVIDRLRVEWLKLLGENRQWKSFDKHFPQVINGDIELTCYGLQSYSQKNYLLALRDVRLLWFDGETLPQSCGALFEQARSVNVIHEHDIRARLVLALEINNVSLATYLADLINKESASLSPDIRKAAANPGRYLSKLSLAKQDQGKRIIALFALHRLAKKNPDRSLSHWHKLSHHFTQSEQQYYYGWLGYEAARNLNDSALKWYALSGKSQLNERQLDWRVRAALRALNWPEVLASINMMPPAQQNNIAWRYWKARALNELGKHREAQTLFVPLSVEFNFYGQLAADELADSPTMSAVQMRYKPDEQAITAMWARPDVQRTVALYRTGLRSE